MANFNREALERADFTVKRVSFKAFENDKFPAVVAELDGKTDVVSIHATGASAYKAAEAYRSGNFPEAPERLNPVGVDLNELLDISQE